MSERSRQLFGIAGADIRGAIFDLDGVLVDTARYHFLAWRRLARELGFEFREEDNERLKGVSRMRSMEILLEIGGLELDERARKEAAERKNLWYAQSLGGLDESALLPGAREYLLFLRENGAPAALGSASRNARPVLERLGLSALLDAVIDGNSVSRAKPDPEVFLKGAEALGLAPQACVVFEDALAGVQAARAAGMSVIAVGKETLLPGADFWISSLADMPR
ncbi:MAG: beta-phosphoglucomutase [Treponema sp.]|nr:beta-phosphoglucomutase [Treponema sp.]